MTNQISGSRQIQDASITDAKLTTSLAWYLIEDKLLGADAANFDFTSIPATYKSLKLIIDTRTDRAANSDGVKIKFNNDGGNNYLGVIQWGGATPGWTQQSAAGAPMIFVYTSANTSTANWFSNAEILIPDYANANKYKSWQSRGMQMVASGANTWVYDAAGIWQSTSAISRITLTPEVGTNFKQYSRAILYGLK